MGAGSIAFDSVESQRRFEKLWAEKHKEDAHPLSNHYPQEVPHTFNPYDPTIDTEPSQWLDPLNGAKLY